MQWLMNRRSQLSIDNLICTYGIQLWGTATNSNKEILQRFQSKPLGIIFNALYYVTNEQLHRDL